MLNDIDKGDNQRNGVMRITITWLER